MNISRRTVKATAIAVIAGLVLTLSGCTGGPTAEEEARDKQQANNAQGNTLEKTNLAEKRRREENPNAIGYVYVMAFGKFIGYYVTKGKISSNGSQAAPEQDIVWTCKRNYDCLPVVVDSAQDDGSYGDGDPGIFFFTDKGVKVVTNLDYIQSDQLLTVNVPQLTK